jgi:hypothetical protein
MDIVDAAATIVAVNVVAIAVGPTPLGKPCNGKFW